MEEVVGSSPISSTRTSHGPGDAVTDGTTTTPATTPANTPATTPANSPEGLLDHLLRGTLLTWWAQQQPDRLAIVSELANQLVRALRRRGAEPGASVAILCRNRPEWAEVWAACTRGGYRLTPVNWHLTGEEAGYIVDDCEAMVLVADARLLAVATEAAADAPARPCGSRWAGRSPASTTTKPRWPPRTPTSTTRRTARRCSTRRAPPAGPRACTGSRPGGRAEDVGGHHEASSSRLPPR